MNTKYDDDKERKTTSKTKAYFPPINSQEINKGTDFLELLTQRWKTRIW